MGTYHLRSSPSSDKAALAAPFAQRGVTRLASIKDTEAVQCVTLKDICEEIAGTKHKLSTGQLRHHYQTDKPAYDKLKVKLSAVLFAGAFSTAKDAGLLTHSGLMVMDFDKIDAADIDTLKHRLAQDPHTVLVFTSPSGHGLKWVVAVTATDGATHRSCWRQAADYARDTFNLDADAGNEPSRKCFLPHDAGLVVKEPKKSFAPSFGVVISGDTEIQEIQEKQEHQEKQRDFSLWPLSKIDLSPHLPTRPNANHREFLWKLARLVKGYEMKAGAEYPYEEITALVRRWFTHSKPEFRPKTLEDYEGEFCNMLKDCRAPLNGAGGEVWETLCAKAETSPPPIALTEPTEISRRLVSLVYHLSLGGRRQFALPQVKIAAHLKCTQAHISGRIAVLERRKLLRQVSKASRQKKLAAEYVWTGEVYD